MYYKALVMEGKFNLANPGEVLFSNSIGIYDDDDNLIKRESVLAKGPIFYDDDEPEDIANALEKWLNGVFYTSDEENIREMIQFLRKHSKELLGGKLRKDMERVEKEMEKLEERKKKLLKRHNELSKQYSAISNKKEAIKRG